MCMMPSLMRLFFVIRTRYLAVTSCMRIKGYLGVEAFQEIRYHLFQEGLTVNPLRWCGNAAFHGGEPALSHGGKTRRCMRCSGGLFPGAEICVNQCSPPIVRSQDTPAHLLHRHGPLGVGPAPGDGCLRLGDVLRRHRGLEGRHV